MFAGVADQVEVMVEDWEFSIGWACYEVEEANATSNLRRHAPRPIVIAAHPHLDHQAHTPGAMAGSSNVAVKVSAGEFETVRHDDLLPSQTFWDLTSRHLGWRLHSELHLPVHPLTPRH